MKLIIFLLAFFVSSVSIGQLKISDVKIDSTITGFHFGGDFKGTILYSPNGIPDVSSKKRFSYFSYYILPNTTIEEAFEGIGTVARGSIEEGFELSVVEETDTIINGNEVGTLLFSRTKGEVTGLVFNGVKMKGTTAFLFVGSDMDREKYIEKLKRTFYAVKL